MDAALIVVGAVLLAFLQFRYRRQQQFRFISEFRFNPNLRDKILLHYPHLNDDQIDHVFAALKDYFWMCLKANKEFVTMPSRVVDKAWHEFILYTKSYQKFCHSAFGRYLHHTPADVLSNKSTSQEGIQRAWALACAKHSFDPKTSHQLPLIFVIDKMLAIPNGFHYQTLSMLSSNSHNMTTVHPVSMTEKVDCEDSDTMDDANNCGNCGNNCGSH
ncbi:MAG: hypothetical protein AAGB12_06085 [Pseudomonadota bacterium]